MKTVSRFLSSVSVLLLLLAVPLTPTLAQALERTPQVVVQEKVVLPDGTRGIAERIVTVPETVQAPPMPPLPERDKAYARLAERYFIWMDGLQRHVTQLESEVMERGLHDTEAYRQWRQSVNEFVLSLQRQRLGAASVAFVNCFNKVSPQIRTELILYLIDKAESFEGLRMLEALLDGVQPTMLGMPSPPRPVTLPNAPLIHPTIPPQPVQGN